MTMIEGMVVGFILAGLAHVLLKWLRTVVHRSRRRTKRSAQELAEFAEHATFRWDEREPR